MTAEGRGEQLKDTIAQHLAAFARDDCEAAFSYVAPSVQRQFGSAEAFLEMVRAKLQPLYRPRSVEFDGHIVVDGSYAQPVRIVRPDGEAVHAMYYMQRQVNGDWRIAGIELTIL